MRSGLIDKRNLTEFQGWTLEEGAIVAPDGWEKLEELLKVGDVPHAAFALRRLLEAELAEACLALAAHVRYREQGRYDSGELLEGVTARFGDILRKARAAAETWSRQSIVQQIDARLAVFQDARAVLNQQLWIVNPTVHYNPGHDVHSNDLRPVVEATRNLLNSLRCAKPGCDSILAVVGGNDEQMLKCKCGEVGWTLEKRKGQAAAAS